MKRKKFVIIICCLALTGCWNGGNTHVSLGDVSLGQQLLDLKSALDGGAISQQEFDETKQTLLALNSLCENTEEEDEGVSWF